MSFHLLLTQIHDDRPKVLCEKNVVRFEIPVREGMRLRAVHVLHAVADGEEELQRGRLGKGVLLGMAALKLVVEGAALCMGERRTLKVRKKDLMTVLELCIKSRIVLFFPSITSNLQRLGVRSHTA
jgi:hypothetical protein